MDHPERKIFGKFIDWMSKNDEDFTNKLLIRHYAEDYRGVHAKQDIRKGETILYVPLPSLVSLDLSFKSPYGKLMRDGGLLQRLGSPVHSFMATFFL